MDLLRQHRVKFVQNLQCVSSVIDHLFSSRVLTRGNKNFIECCQNHDDQVRELLDVITSKGPKVLDRFYNALNTTDNVELAELLKSDTCKLSKMETGGETPLPPKHKPKQQKVLVLYGKEENKEIKENIQLEPDTCTRIKEKIKNAASSHLQSLVIIILGDFDGNAVEDIMSHNKIAISEICATLKSILPGKQKMCILLHTENTEVSPVWEKTDSECQLVALRENRLKELNKKLKGITDDFFSCIANFINDNEIIWSSLPGYILLLDGSDENKEVGEFLRKQCSNLNFKFDTETCTLIENKLKRRVQSLQKNPAYFVAFLLGQFNGDEVEDVCSGDGVHITQISVTVKGMLPKIMKICILLQRDNVELNSVKLDKENDETLMIISLTNERLNSLMEKLNNSTDSVPFCIKNFVNNSNEKIW